MARRGEERAQRLREQIEGAMEQLYTLVDMTPEEVIHEFTLIQKKLNEYREGLVLDVKGVARQKERNREINDTIRKDKARRMNARTYKK